MHHHRSCQEYFRVPLQALSLVRLRNIRPKRGAHAAFTGTQLLLVLS